jgi:hypothetical protein
MTADRFLWTGTGGVFWADCSALGISAGSVSREYAKVIFPPLARIPVSAVTPERLASLVASGAAKLDDAGFPGPRRADVAEAFHRTVSMNGAHENEAFKSALRDIYTAARDGHAEKGDSA